MAARLLLAAIVAVLVVFGAVAVPLVVADDSSASGDDLAGVMGPPNGVHDEDFEEESANLSAVKTFKAEGLIHETGEIDYDESPPIGGPHDQVWLECGVYDREVREENAVHALEHGTVWITYTSDLSDDEVGQLEDALPDEGILSPYDEQEAAVVVTVWNAQLALDGVDDPRLALFLGQYGDGSTSPEPMASCHGGVEKFEDDGTGA
ncbi:DUF3105 domain-containing protein [Nocardioides sp. Root140]|uniref:DUF3105 domain-containing protein n=1 Tax=Nocardioides sp. Root140 TaxID=1736460 RepID=UPI0006FDC795|nr:DUF3105 domain-containing protein [Nocardioides sp. Root140]KQY64105.1 hypothetical protein ASD30_03845 [Nocardioides sp. Root140]